jgi:hypothetical protein
MLCADTGKANRSDQMEPTVTIEETLAVSAHVRACGFPADLSKRHLHDQFTADAGANPPELLARMGRDSARAARVFVS